VVVLLPALKVYQQDERKQWSQCLADGQKWSQNLWQNKEEGPSDAAALKKKKGTPPPVVRAGPQRNRHRKDDQDPDPERLIVQG